MQTVKERINATKDTNKYIFIQTAPNAVHVKWFGHVKRREEEHVLRRAESRKYRK